MDCVTCRCKKLYCLNNYEYVYCLNFQQYSAIAFQEHFHRYSSQNRQGPPSESVTILLLGTALLAFSGLLPRSASGSTDRFPKFKATEPISLALVSIVLNCWLEVNVDAQRCILHWPANDSEIWSCSSGSAMGRCFYGSVLAQTPAVWDAAALQCKNFRLSETLHLIGLQQVPQVPQIAWSLVHNPGEWESEILRAFLQLCKVRNCSFISVLAMMCLDIVLPFACRQYARSIDVRFVHHIHTTSTWQKRGSSSCWAQVYGAGLVLWSRAAQRVWRAPVSQLHISTIILAVHLEALQCETCTVYVISFSFLSR